MDLVYYANAEGPHSVVVLDADTTDPLTDALSDLMQQEDLLSKDDARDYVSENR